LKKIVFCFSAKSVNRFLTILRRFKNIMANEEIIGSSSVGAIERPFKFEGNHFKR
jgi:hypothetical protein